MVLFRGHNYVGAGNRDERGAYEELDDRVKTYMKMTDEEWEAKYKQMSEDRKYPGRNNFKLVAVPGLLYAITATSLSYEMYLRRANLFGHTSNIVKVALIPVLGLLTLRNMDVAVDILKYRHKYPEMYRG